MCKIKLYYDLHIHSVLSPDADDFMTPNNILNMAMLKNLDFLAITDHNSAKQLNIIEQIEVAYDFIFIPGIEVTVLEGYDVLCYFRSYGDAEAFDSIVELYLTDDFGPFTSDDQMITDIYDMTVDTIKKSLTKTTMPFRLLHHEVKKLDGAIVLAHIERNSKSVLNKHKLSDVQYDAVEIQQYNKALFLENHPDIKREKILTNSDSHTLLQISEREHSVELKEKTIDAFFDFLIGSDK